MDYSCDYNNLKEDLHEEAGLTFWGLDEEGQPEWVGTNEQWNNYELLTQSI